MKTDNIHQFLNPPGCLNSYLAHPSGNRTSIPFALMQEHRFAFYYWSKWTQELNGSIPSLVTFDWHQDLSVPYKDQVPELKRLKIDNRVEVALYTWGKLSHFNDVQIHAAVKHNMLKDVYVICRQDVNRKEHDILKDFEGRDHYIHIFKSVEAFKNHLPKIQDNKIYLDIDLDYFTYSNPLSVKNPFPNKAFTYMKKSEVIKLLSIENPMVQWLFERLAGFTMATEPEFCGGLNKSNYYLNVIDQLYFTPSLFHTVPGQNMEWTKWKHLTD